MIDYGLICRAGCGLARARSLLQESRAFGEREGRPIGSEEMYVLCESSMYVQQDRLCIIGEEVVVVFDNIIYLIEGITLSHLTSN